MRKSEEKYPIQKSGKTKPAKAKEKSVEKSEKGKPRIHLIDEW